MGRYAMKSTSPFLDTNRFPQHYSVRDNLVNDQAPEQEQFDPWHSSSSPVQRESLNYFDPGYATQSFPSGAATSVSLGSQYSDIIKDENDLTNSLIRQIDQEGASIESGNNENDFGMLNAFAPSSLPYNSMSVLSSNNMYTILSAL